MRLAVGMMLILLAACGPTEPSTPVANSISSNGSGASPTGTPTASLPRPAGSLPSGHPLADASSLQARVDAYLATTYGERFGEWTVSAGAQTMTSETGDSVGILACSTGTAVELFGAEEANAQLPYRSDPSGSFAWMTVA